MPETHIDIDGPQDLVLSLETTATADELWSRWQYLSELAQKAGQHDERHRPAWKEATDPVAKRMHLGRVRDRSPRAPAGSVAPGCLFYAAHIFSSTTAPTAPRSTTSPPR